MVSLVMFQNVREGERWFSRLGERKSPRWSYICLTLAFQGTCYALLKVLKLGDSGDCYIGPLTLLSALKPVESKFVERMAGRWFQALVSQEARPGEGQPCSACQLIKRTVSQKAFALLWPISKSTSFRTSRDEAGFIGTATPDVFRCSLVLRTFKPWLRRNWKGDPWVLLFVPFSFIPIG